MLKKTPYKVVRGSITEDLEKETLLEVPARVRMLLNQPKVPRFVEYQSPSKAFVLGQIIFSPQE